MPRVRMYLVPLLQNTSVAQKRVHSTATIGKNRETERESVSIGEEVIIDHISWKSISLVNAMTQRCLCREKHFDYATWNLILIDLLTVNDNPKLVEINASECFHQNCQGR